MDSSILRAVFNDFGPKFTCVDPTGEQAVSGMVASIDKVSIMSMILGKTSEHFEYIG